ncbi:TlpA disulfide reductase family protein [Mucilaginibacter panaciglaebae]
MKNQTYLLSIKSLFILLLMLFTLQSFSQQKDYTVRELKIGDTIPDIVVKGLINSSSNTVQISDLYKHGLLIIDFWATWCIPCIQELPKLDTLRAKFPRSLSVLSVAYEDSIIIKKFLKRNTDINISNIKIATNDVTLVKYFKHIYIPHNVWIDKKGVIKAITNSEEINEENVTAFLNNKNVEMNVKKDITSFKYSDPFHLGDSIYRYRSIFTPNINGIGGGDISWGTHEEGMNRYFGYNRGIIDLFWIVYTQNTAYYNIDYKRIVIQTKDSIKYFRPKQINFLADRSKYKRNIDWEKDNLYCYDLTLPQKVPDTIFYKYMADDFQRIFNVTYTIENRKMLCNVVSCIPGSKYSLTNFHSEHPTITKAVFFKNQLILKDATIKDLVAKVLSTWKDGDDLWIDESGILFPIDLVIDFDKDKPITMETLKSKLKEYGLVVDQKIRSYPIMVLKDNNL